MFLHRLRRSVAAALVVIAMVVPGLVRPVRAQSPAPISLRIATSPAASTAEVYVAQELGIFKKYGLDAQIQTLSKGMGSAVTAVVLGKAADVGEADIVAMCAAHEHGIPLVILAPSNAYIGTSAPINVLVVAKTSPVKAAKDLDGKIIGAPSLEGPAKLSAEKWLDDHGADVSTIKFIEMSVASMPAALQNGTIGAGMVSEPTLTVAANDLRTLGASYQESYGKAIQVSYWFATPEWMQANPDAAKRFAQAMHETALWVNDPKNADRYAQILQKVTGIAPDVAKAMRHANYGEYVDVAQAQPLIDAGLKYKSLKSACDAKSFVGTYAMTK